MLRFSYRVMIARFFRVQLSPDNLDSRLRNLAPVLMTAVCTATLVISPALAQDIRNPIDGPPEQPPPEEPPPEVSSVQGLSPHFEYRKRVEATQAISPLDMGVFGDQVSLYNGSTEFSVTDIDLPGNNELPVQLVRRLAVEIQPQSPTAGDYDTRLSGASNWDVDVPYLAATFPSTSGWPTPRCDSRGVPTTGFGGFPLGDVWQGVTVHVPGRDNALLIGYQTGVPRPTDGGTYRMTNSQRDAFDCIPMRPPASGEGIRMTTTSGLRYYFDVTTSRTAATLVRIHYTPDNQAKPVQLERERVYLLASKIEDRFGNTVEFDYNAAGHPTRIYSTDGREIVLTYSSGRLTQATAHGRTWKYRYWPDQQLKEVEHPDTSLWQYAYDGTLRPSADPDGVPALPYCAGMQPILISSWNITITHPAGATGSFAFSNTRHYRSGVHASECDMILPPPHLPLGTEPTYLLRVPYYFDVMSVQSKTITGPGLPSAQVWGYEYILSPQTQWGTFSSLPSYPCTTCQAEKQVVLHRPDGSALRHRFGMRYYDNDGRLLGIDTLNSASAVVQAQTNTWMTEVQASGQPFHGVYGGQLGLTSSIVDPATLRVRPLTKRQFTQQGRTFTWQANSFDSLARPASVTRSSNVSGSPSRTEETLYHDNSVKWILGQVAQVKCTAPTTALPTGCGTTGTVMRQTSFDATYALPLVESQFGQTVSTRTWNTTATVASGQRGTLSTIKDGKNNTTTLSNWYRGVPRSISYPGGASQSAVVNARGEITSVTDEMGYTTNYGYDLMGRLSSITHPTGDTTTWSSTIRSFTQVNTAEFGIPAGHWRLTETTGTHAKDTYYDGLWRPLLTRERDTSNSATTRYVKRAFDHENRETFASYPSTSSSPTTGTWTSYDALGRPTSVSQDSELGLLTTTTQYLTNFGTRTTNPRGYQTTTYYQAFDTPSQEAPTSLSEPGGVSTAISRDVFGKPTAITRSGYWNSTYQSATRHFVYNAQQRLCKRVDPESGATLLDYDAAGNLLWSARSTSLTSTSACQTASVPTSTRSTRGYDARNRLTSITHPAGTASESYSYYADGALHTASTTDGGTWTYAYNKRRLPTSETLTLGAKTFAIGYGYTGLGHLSTLTYPSGLSLSFNPNALGQPRQAGSYASAATYHPNGSLAGFTYGNSLIHSQTQNSRGLPSRIRDRSGSTSRLDYSYSYDKHGNITSIVDGVNANENRSLQYDARDRLTVATAPNIYGEEIYDYDVLDNVRRLGAYPNGLGGYVMDYRYQYTTNQRLTRIDNESGVQQWGFSHNGFGETLTRAGHDRTWYYQWNAAGRMTRADRYYGGTTWETYVYDAHGHRTRATRNTGTTRHQIYNRAGQLLYVEDTRDNQRIDYIHLGGKLVAQRSRPISSTTATTTYHHTDSIQSANVETNTAGTQTQRTVRMPYGSPYDGVYREGPGFAGHVTDTQTNLTYMQQRYYDPVALRFLSPDPVDVSPTTGSNFNRYWYANNNPYRYRDPDGREVICTATSCTATGNSLGEALVDGLTLGIIYTKQTLNNVFNESAAPSSPPLPGGLIGEQDTGSRTQGGRHNSGPLSGVNGGSGNAETDFGNLTGGQSAPAPEGSRLPAGSQVGENGIIYRPETSTSGPRIDIPANGDKPHETLHYPKPPQPLPKEDFQ